MHESDILHVLESARFGVFYQEGIINIATEIEERKLKIHMLWYVISINLVTRSKFPTNLFKWNRKEKKIGKRRK